MQKLNTPKYEIVPQDSIQVGGCQLYRIRALKPIPGRIDAGEWGGYVSGPDNLSQEGDCWISRDAMAFDGARVLGNAQVKGMGRVAGGAILRDKACVEHRAQVIGPVEMSLRETLGGEEMLLNVTILDRSQFVREGNTRFTFAYRAGNFEGIFMAHAETCGDETAGILSVYPKNKRLACYVGRQATGILPLPPEHEVLKYKEALRYL